MLDHELDQLPEKYRLPLILVYLQGHKIDEAATILGLNESSLRTRLSRGRERLRVRLSRLGIGISAVPLATAIKSHAQAVTVPNEFVSHATCAVTRSSGGVNPSESIVSLASLCIRVRRKTWVAKHAPAEVYGLLRVSGDVGLDEYIEAAQADNRYLRVLELHYERSDPESPGTKPRIYPEEHSPANSPK